MRTPRAPGLEEDGGRSDPQRGNGRAAGALESAWSGFALNAACACLPTGTFAAMTYSHEPDIRPLGALALAAAVVSVALSWTYFLSPLAYLAAVVALSLGLLSRGHERSRSLGNLAAVLALVVATVTLLVV